MHQSFYDRQTQPQAKAEPLHLSRYIGLKDKGQYVRRDTWAVIVNLYDDIFAFLARLDFEFALSIRIAAHTLAGIFDEVNPNLSKLAGITHDSRGFIQLQIHFDIFQATLKQGNRLPERLIEIGFPHDLGIAGSPQFFNRTNDPSGVIRGDQHIVQRQAGFIKIIDAASVFFQVFRKRRQ